MERHGRRTGRSAKPRRWRGYGNEMRAAMDAPAIHVCMNAGRVGRPDFDFGTDAGLFSRYKSGDAGFLPDAFRGRSAARTAGDDDARDDDAPRV